MRSPAVPGEVRVVHAPHGLVLIRDIRLGSKNFEARADAILDTGSTHCIVSRSLATRLGFAPGNRSGTLRIQGVGGVVTMDRHRLQYVRAGTAQCYAVDFLVGEGPGQLMLLGLSFIARFQTTLDLDAMRVVFRSRRSG